VKANFVTQWTLELSRLMYGLIWFSRDSEHWVAGNDDPKPQTEEKGWGGGINATGNREIR
jgi:hypothetical protein